MNLYPHESQNKDDLNHEIMFFGRDIFKYIGQASPSTFNPRGLSGKLMKWSMEKPDLKVSLFRLVDVLPTLKSSKSVARHTCEYLAKPIRDVSAPLSYLLKANPGKLRSALTSWGVRFGVHQMSKQFIAGHSPQTALNQLKRIRKKGMSFTVDLLGEFSVSEREALTYVARYTEALSVMGNNIPSWPSAKPIISEHPGERTAICASVKLTALYSQCSPMNFDQSVAVLSDRLSQIVRKAREVDASLYIDAEDSANNPIIYEVFKKVFSSGEFKDFPLPGIVIQAYLKGSEERLKDLIRFAKSRGSQIAIRLVKGAYWDQETILAEQQQWPAPVFSIKESSDANYEKLSRILIDHAEHCFPAFGSHNIRSLSHACTYSASKGLAPKDFEVQMLYGMAEPIALAFKQKGYLVRFYVPVGEILPGMGYLVRRLLENTSNESFLRHTFFESENIDALLREPQMLD